jgi:hypothetical protein
MTLVEVVLAISVAALALTTTMAVVLSHRVLRQKSAEQAVLLNFARSYLETLRNQPFDEIRVGQRLNAEFPDLLIPAAGEWEPLTNAGYLLFDPALLDVESRRPELQVEIRNGAPYTLVDGTATRRHRHLVVRVRWQGRTTTGEVQREIVLEGTVYPEFRS